MADIVRETGARWVASMKSMVLGWRLDIAIETFDVSGKVCVVALLVMMVMEFDA